MKPEIPVFFATNNSYAPFLSCALISMLENASKDYFYKIHVLTSELSSENKSKLKKSITQNSSIEFINLKDKLSNFQGMFHTRDYYSKETYYRLFIANLFPEYNKILYLDADMIFLGDVSQIYNIDLKNYLVAAVHEDVMNIPVYKDYVEKALGIPYRDYFNAGMLVMNTENFRIQHIEEKFISLLKRYTFKLTQDEDYLNVLCQGQVYKLHAGWNKSDAYEPEYNPADLKIIHYKMNSKPWHYDGVENEAYFWEYAKRSPFYDEIKYIKASYSDEQKQKDTINAENMIKLAIHDANDIDNYWNTMSQGAERYAIVKGINKVFHFPKKAVKSTKKVTESLIKNAKRSFDEFTKKYSKQK